jgi:hypothetical protein
MGEVEELRHPYTGQPMLLRKDVVKPEVMTDFSTFESSMDETAPSAYYIPSTLLPAATPQAAAQNDRLLAGLADKLTAHGIRFTRLAEPSTVAVEQFAISANTQSEREFQAHRMRTLEGSWQPASDVTLPAGTIVVPVAQPLGRIAFYLLEPRSDDGWVTWNVLDPVLGADVKTYPIVRKR